MKNQIGFCLVVLAILGGCSQGPEKSQPKAPTAVQSETKPEAEEGGGGKLELSDKMKAAIAEARKTLPEFWKAWEKDGYGKGDYIVNVQFMSEDGTRGEFLWMSVEAKGEGEITGVLEGPPTLRKDIKAGDRLTVKESDVVDWMFLPDDGDHKGGYTLSALGT